MRYARSMRFGGQLIEASECDYEDYKKLGLLCPVCKNMVFLVGETTRTRGDKTFKVSAHFNHFPQQKAFAEQCELRVKKYSEKEIKKALNQARGQRAKFFKRWFWQIIIDRRLHVNLQSLSAYFKVHQDNYGSNLEYTKEIDNLYDHVIDYLKHKKDTKLSISGFFEHLENEAKPINFLDKRKAELFNEILTELKSRLDVKMQIQICEEALQFACQKTNRYHFCGFLLSSVPILLSLGKTLETALQVTPDTVANYAAILINNICATNWAKEFDKQSNPKNN